MKQLKQLLALTGVAVALGLSTSDVAAQGQGRPGRGGFGGGDPEQFRQQMMDRYKERLEVKSDDEWKIISERIEKVMTAQRELRAFSGFGGFGGGGGRGGRGGGGGGDNAGGGGGGNRGGNRFGGEPNPDVEALQKAIDDKASADDIKAKLGKVRDARKGKEANLAKAQDELQKVLSVKQEGTAVLLGLLK